MKNFVGRVRTLQAVAALQRKMGECGMMRCMACNTYKMPTSRWLVGGYTPGNPQHPSIAYALCAECAPQETMLRKAAVWAETKSREYGDRDAAS